MIKAAIIGLGKMGLSHHAIVNAHPDIEVQAVCDTTGYVLDVLSKYTGVKTYTDYRKMLAELPLDCVFVATPSKHHAQIVGLALERGLHVFCEKPFGLSPEIAYGLADTAERNGLVNQVGYHYRFVATFNEAKRILDSGAIGALHHARIEAYGPVVLRPKGSTWRSQISEGGGCLYDYACHAIDLANYLVGRPLAVSGTVFNSVFSDGVDDEIYSTLHFADKFQGQLAANWSDESHRKMSVRMSFWGTNGRLNVDRQELQVYVRSADAAPNGFTKGWSTKYTTELTKPVWFYMRGEEYSAQIDHFAQCIKTGSKTASTFRTAADTILVASMLRADAAKETTGILLGDAPAANAESIEPPKSRKGLFSWSKRG